MPKCIMQMLGPSIHGENEALEALFAQELPGGKPAKIAPDTATALIEKGLIQEQVIRLGEDVLGAYSVAAHVLTYRGHLHYCESCRDVDAAELWALK